MINPDASYIHIFLPPLLLNKELHTLGQQLSLVVVQQITSLYGTFLKRQHMLIQYKDFLHFIVPKFHYHIHNSLSATGLYSAVNESSLQPPPIFLSNIIIHPSLPRSLKQFFLSGFPVTLYVNFSFLLMHATFPSGSSSLVSQSQYCSSRST